MVVITRVVRRSFSVLLATALVLSIGCVGGGGQAESDDVSLERAGAVEIRFVLEGRTTSPARSMCCSMERTARSDGSKRHEAVSGSTSASGVRSRIVPTAVSYAGRQWP